jgi:hypothetical protein
MKTLLTPNKSPQKRKYRIWNKANNSKEKVRRGLFGYDSVLEQNTKNLGNSHIFLSINHKSLSAKRFRSYRILKIDFTAEFCFWTEQRLNETQLLGLGLTETPEVPNTIIVGNFLSFPMVHNMALSNRRFMSYDCQKLNWCAEIDIWADYTSRHKSGMWQNFAMTSLETLNTKIAATELSFPLVTHMAGSSARFDSYGILKSGHGAEQVLARLGIQPNDQVLME